MMGRVLAYFLAFVPAACIFNGCDDEGNGLDEKTGIFWIENNSTLVSEDIFYVSASGDDGQDGLSESTAFRTLSKALSNLHPGGTVRILPGVYNEGIGMVSCGSSEAPMTIEGYGGVPTLDGNDEIAIGLYFEMCHHLQIRNLKVANYTDIGIGFSTGSMLVLEELEIAENGHAVQLKSWELEGYGIHVDFSEEIEITGCDVYRNGPDPQKSPDYLMGTGINTYGNSNVEITENLSYDNIGGGILVEDSHDVLVEGNEVYGNDLDATEEEWWDGGLWLDGGAGVIVRDNHFHDNLGPGIQISDEDLQNPTGYGLYDNISSGNYYGIFIWNFGTTGWPPESIIKRSGNTFSGNSRQDIWIEDWY